MLKVAIRNILRNRRRSLMTVLAIAAGAMAILLLGAFMARVIISFQTLTVQRTGHLQIYQKGYFDFGRSEPGTYSIDNSESIITMIKKDRIISDLVNVVTPTVVFLGVGGNADLDISTPVLGVGAVPADRGRMLQWDEYQVVDDFWRHVITAKGSGLSDEDSQQGTVGIGLARNLGLCEHLAVRNCPRRPAPRERGGPSAGSGDLDIINGLTAGVRAELASPADGPAHPRIDVLAATVGGAPNIVSVSPRRADFMGVKELDDIYVGMHLTLAQQVLYGRGERKATGIIIQLHRTQDTDKVLDRLLEIFSQNNLNLEVFDYAEITQMYKQTIDMFVSIFTFTSVIMGVIVLFTMTNTMGMSVMERTNEIGTLRAIGVRRSGIRRQFLVEGAMLGGAGAAIGLLVGLVIAHLFNRVGLTWTPPTMAGPIPLLLLISGLWRLILPGWFCLVGISTLAALIPANRAARMAVVDALRHV